MKRCTPLGVPIFDFKNQNRPMETTSLLELQEKWQGGDGLFRALDGIDEKRYFYVMIATL